MKDEGPDVLAVDLGTSGCKCALVSLGGRVRSWAFEPVTTTTVGPDGAEQDPQEWWRAFVVAGRQAVSQAGTEVVAVCVSAQSEVTVAVDRGGRPLRPALLWWDMRGREALRRRAGGGLLKVAGYDPLKLLRWIRLTGGAPSLSGKDPAGHMLLIQDQWPEVYEQTHRFLNAADYLNFRLTGRMAATPDSILTSWVTDNRDPGAVSYHDGLIRSLDLDREKLPEIVGCTDVLGPIRHGVAAEVGLPEGIPVVAGSIDVSAAAVGSGAVDMGRVHLYVGTSSWLGAHVPRKRTDLGSQIAAVPCAQADRYLMIAMQSAGGSNLSFLRDRILGPTDERLALEEERDAYQALDRLAEAVPAGARGLLYTPWLSGERCPRDEATLRAGLLNLSSSHAREDTVRAVLEGVAFNTRWMLGPVRRFLGGGEPPDITAVGGGGASALWCQIFADVLNVPIRQVESPLQANALGSAFIAGVGLGEGRFEDVPRLVRTARIHEPRQENRAVYDDAYGAFVEVYDRLAPLYRRLNEARP